MSFDSVARILFVSAQEFLKNSAQRLSSKFSGDETASLLPMLKGEVDLQLTTAVSRFFFGLFHQAHVHVYELDVPIDADQAIKSSGSVASHALQDLQTSAAGLYVAFNSDTGLLAEDSAIMHESPQAQHPRILLASLVSRRGKQRRTRYAPLIPLPSTLPASDLHPWNTCMHSTKIPLALVVGRDSQAVDALIYLQPRYSQYCLSFAGVERQHWQMQSSST